MYRAFFAAIITEIKDELKKKLKSSFWERVKNSFSASFDELFEELDSLLQQMETDQFISVLGIKGLEVHSKEEETNKTGYETNLSAAISEKPELKASFASKDSYDVLSEEETQ